MTERAFPNLITQKEAAGLLKVSERQLGRLRESGAFSWYQIGERKLYDRDELAAYVLARQRRAA